MLSCSAAATNCYNFPLTPNLSPTPNHSLSLSVSSSHCVSSLLVPQQLSSHHACGRAAIKTQPRRKTLKIVSSRDEPLKVMISGAPASGKGTQCEMIAQKYGVVHISTGDILRVEVSASTEIGNKAKEYMDSGRLVPDEIVTAMVTTRLTLKDVKEKGWLLDGYPRSSAQAESLEKLSVRPDVYIMLEVPDDVLIDRCVGRRLDPLTGKIYHVKNFPPENEEIKERLVTRPDDTEEKVKSRLEIYKKNVESILSTYSDIMFKINGNRSKDIVFEEIDSLLSRLQKDKEEKAKLGKLIRNEDQLDKLFSEENKWRGIPTRLNNIPHSREIRTYFYEDVLQATKRAIKDGKTRMKVEISIPELNPEMDVYRIGTLMELVRIIALSFADDAAGD